MSRERSIESSVYESIATPEHCRMPKTQIQKYRDTQNKFLKSAGGAVTNLV